ncbi:helix-turn-helix domain-containing protein [Sphingomonas sp. dw_22]|uniref:winged helix-turn-helix transcriptional regulator n=1 Tax=Sphingomonas sp. dw_22 TaxID=2721175 RepID=UPI002116411C|nr:helix-turn-helix domain-containing protein [Sphingomonas sp. dw_22]
MEQGHTADSCTPVRAILARVGDKWSILTIMLLSEGTKRFSELQRAIDGISQRMLTLTLRGLERDGLVSRAVFPTIPPRVEYTLTPLGQSLTEPVNALGKWVMANLPEIDAARRKFDGALEEQAA